VALLQVLTNVGGDYLLVTQDGRVIQVFTGPQTSGGSGGLVPQPSSLLGVQIIDPQNVTGVATANGANTATVPGYDGAGYTGRVWTSFVALTQAWGTFEAVVINAPLTLVWASSDSGDSDTAVIGVYALGSTASFSIIGNTPTVIRTDTLSGVVPKDRAAGANSQLLANLNASTVRGTRLQRTNGTKSTAWAYALAESDSWALTQPTAATALEAIPGSIPTQVNNWANSDTVNEVQATKINLCSVTFFQEDYNASCVLYGFDVLAPDTGDSNLQLNGNRGSIIAWEVGTARALNSVALGAWDTSFSNVYFDAQAYFSGAPNIISGACDYENCTNFFINTASGFSFPSLDGDFVLGAATVQISTASRVLMGYVCLDSSDGIDVECGLLQATPGSYGGTCVYGGQVNGTETNIYLQGTARLAWDVATGPAGCFTFPLAISSASGVSMNGRTGEAAYVSIAGGVGTIHTGQATTVANMQSVYTATGGGLSNLPFGGGASIVPGAYA
jgi:hypothetical protein